MTDTNINGLVIDLQEHAEHAGHALNTVLMNAVGALTSMEKENEELCYALARIADCHHNTPKSIGTFYSEKVAIAVEALKVKS